MSFVETQQDELLCLQSILKEEEFVLEVKDPPSGYMVAEVRLSVGFFVAANEDDVFPVNHLPPIILNFYFPEDYPLKKCPTFYLSCDWLSPQQLSALCGQLKYLWEETMDVIMYTWMQFLQEEALDFLNISQCLNISKLLSFTAKDNFEEKVNTTNNSASGTDTVSSALLPQATNVVLTVSGFKELSDTELLLRVLKDYNELKTQSVFDTTLQECEVCVCRKQGFEFIQFSNCNHFFCKDCVKNYYEELIKNGKINSLKCLHEECDTRLDESTIKGLVRPDLYEKYDEVLLSSTLEGMSDIAFCPRKSCQCPSIIDMENRLAMCSACEFVFCPFCKNVFHGINMCDYSSKKLQQIYQEYSSGNRSKKEEIKKKYGKRFINSLVTDTLSENWKKKNSKRCPKCHTYIEKDEGCNKMTCFRCGNAFCWLCLKALNLDRPYDHFNDPTAECYLMLFPQHLLAAAEDEQPAVQNVQPGEYLGKFIEKITISGLRCKLGIVNHY